MKHRALAIALSIAILAPALVVSAGVQERFGYPGTDLPVTMKPADLTEGYKPFKLKEQSSGALGDYYSSAYFQFAALGVGPGSLEDKRLQELFEILPVSWTQHSTVKVYGQEFLITYIMEPSIETVREFSRGRPLAEPELKLKLIKTDQIGTIEPYPELNREKFLTILGRLTQKGEPLASPSVRTNALSNVKQLALGTIMYMADFDDIFPYVHSTKTLQRVTAPYLKNNELWKNLNPKGGQLRFNMCLSGASAMSLESPAETPLIYDSIAWPDGRFLVSYTDGHAKFVEASAWAAQQKYLKLKLKKHGKPIK